MNTGSYTHSWAMTIVDQLIKQGVTYFCYAPGSRSTPLALALAENESAEKFIHFDERGLAFHALGHAKATKKPVAIIVTSGTAVGNLMPAVMEASFANIPLLLLTCDRPMELRDVMANQTADQMKFFGEYVRTCFEFLCPEIGMENYLATTIAQAVLTSCYPLPGPVHLNCPFREPFFDEKKGKVFDVATPKLSLPKLSLSEEMAKKWAQDLEGIEKGVIVLGGNVGTKSAHFLSKKLGWPIFADIASSNREKGNERGIPYYHHILKTLPDLDVDAVLYFGDACVSKVLLQWISRQKKVIHVSPYHKRWDPLHAVTHRVISNLEEFCEKVSFYAQKRGNGWFEHWENLGEKASPVIETSQLTEPAIIKMLEKSVTPATAVFFGNSMPIRDAEMFFFPSQGCGPIFANRGLSGIDGNIATIAGIAQNYPLIAILGDQTFLHDLNSLGQLHKTSYPVKLIVINNGGGGIFSFLPIQSRKEVLDTYFAAAHEMTFEKAAEFFDIPYQLILTDRELEKAFSTIGPSLIEVRTIREENRALHDQIDTQIQRNLCSCFSMVS